MTRFVEPKDWYGVEGYAGDADSPAAGLLEDAGRRVPFVVSPKGFYALSYLTEDEQRLGAEIFESTKMVAPYGVEQPADHAVVQARNPYCVYQADPTLIAKDLSYGEIIQRLTMGVQSNEEIMSTTQAGFQLDPEVGRRLQAGVLIVAKIMHEYGDEWGLRLVGTGPSWAMISREQLSLLDTPQSVVWDEEQRLVLEFTHAVFHRAVSDELFARAETAWGRKQLLRYLAWIVRYIAMLMFDDTNVSDAERTGRW